jgi:hypothetical protein
VLLNLHFKKIFFLLILFSADLSAANRAVVIGISQYTEINNLKYADADARAFSQLLTEFSDFSKQNVTVLLNQQATKKKISQEIVKVIEDSKKNQIDNFIFMFAGHGVESRIKTQGKNKKIEERETNIFLAPTDASLNENNFFINSTGKEITNETFINKEWLAQQLSRINAKTISVVIDSCYSGNKSFFSLLEKEHFSDQAVPKNITREFSIQNIDRNGLINPKADRASKKLAYLASSRDDQASAEYDELRHGALSYAMFEYIRWVRQQIPNSQKKLISIDDLYANIVRLFDETKVDGKPLNSAHQPILFALPDYMAVQKMGFLSIQGSAAQEAKKQAILKLITDVKNYEIYVDGIKKQDDSSNQLFFNPGKYLIELFLPDTGYRFSFTKDIKEGDFIEEQITLRGDLEVASLIEEKRGKAVGPPIEIFLNGSLVDKSNKYKTNLIAGTHLLEVRFQNITKAKQVEIRPGSPLKVNYTLKNVSLAPNDDRGVRNVPF